MSKIYQYLVNIGDNDHIKVYARNFRGVEWLIDKSKEFDKSMINSITRGEIKKP